MEYAGIAAHAGAGYAQPSSNRATLTRLPIGLYQSMSNRQDVLVEALDTEQRVVSRLYARLDAARERAESALRTVHRRGGGTSQAMVEREALAAEQARRLRSEERRVGKEWRCRGRPRRGSERGAG